MKKKITLTLLFINFLVSVALSFYLYYQPAKTTVTPGLENITLIPYETLKDYLVNAGDSSTHYLFFCAPENTDCIYILDTVIKPLEAKQGEALFERLDYVDFTALEENLETNQTVVDWGINSYPAFLAVTVEDSEFIVQNFIQHNDEDPISEIELKRWLAENGIWSGVFELTDQKVDLP